MATTGKARTPEVELDRRHKIGLPPDVVERAELKAGDRLSIQVRRDGSVLLTKVTDPLEKFIGAAPGISGATNLEALRDEWAR